MKRKLFSLIAAIAISTTITSCERVAPNYQGVLMENYGKAGKSDYSLQKGRVWTAMPGQELFQVPLFEQRAGFNGAVKLKSSDNTEFTSTPSYSYSVIESRAVDVVFQNSQVDDNGDDFMTALEDNILEPKIYDLMKEESRRYTTDDLMANGGQLKFEEALQELVKKEFETRGLKLKTFSSQLDFSAKVREKIDSRNEVNTNITVLDQKIEEQKKQNELARLQAEEMKIISSGLTDKILQDRFIDKWDGSTEIYGSAPFFIRPVGK